MFFAACGDEVTTQVIQDNNMSIVSTTKELPKCTKDNEGEQAFVKGETAPRVCMDGKWFATSSGGKDTVIVKDTVVVKEKSTCTTKELKDKSGVKIICGGDSVGVVLNGKDGANGKNGADGKDGANGKDGADCSVATLADNSGLKVVCGGDSVGVVLNGQNGANGKDGSNGKDGVGCSVASKTDSSVTIACGTDKFTMSLGGGSAVNPDTGNVVYEIENASISGVSQKGPFVKGATVTAFELDGSKSLLQTGRTFVGNITQDDGRFNMSNVTLKSSYVRLSANGYYRNEVSGKNSTAPITLNAVTDLGARNTVNVNLLTHLEYDRVAHLMAQGDGTLKIKKLKKQAEGEIFKAFHFDDLADFGYSEDLDVFGKTDADAALLAISILLQGDRDEAGLTALLSGFSNDFKDGKWDSAQVKAEIADSVLSKDAQKLLLKYRANVKGWGLSTTVPDFEKYIRRFASIEDSLGVCGVDEKVGTVKNVTNKNSKKYYARSYTDTSSSVSGKTRFICIDSTGVGKMWRVATDLEKDRFNWNPKNTKDGGLLGGPVSGRKLVWDADTLRHADDSEVNGGEGCTSYNRNELKILNKDVDGRKQYSFYRCTEDGWSFTLDTLNRGTIVYEGQTYRTIGIKTQMWFAENLNYEVDNSYCYNNSPDSCAKYGRLYTWRAAIDSLKLATDADHPLDCDYGKLCGLTGTVRGICPEGWHIPTSTEWETLYSAMDSSHYAMQAKGYDNWSSATDAYGFSVLPAGYYNGSRFDGVGSATYFWSATESRNAVYHWYMNVAGWGLGSGNFGSRNFTMSVRCVKDAED